MDGEQQSLRSSEEVRLLAVTDLANEVYQRVIEQRLDSFAEVAGVRGIDLCRDLQGHPQALCYGDGPIWTLLGGDTPQKSEIAARGWTEGEHVFGHAMVDSPNPVGEG